MLKPVLHAGNPAQVFAHMLFADPTDRHLATIAVGERCAKDLLTQIDAFRMMTEGAMSQVSHHRLGRIEPVVDAKIVSGCAAPSPRAALGMKEGMHSNSFQEGSGTGWLGAVQLRLVVGALGRFDFGVKVLVLVAHLSQCHIEGNLTATAIVVLIASRNQIVGQFT